jgi:nitroreductase
MSLLSKWVLGRMGRLRAHPLEGRESPSRIELPPPDVAAGLPLMQALARRRAGREFGTAPLSMVQLSELLWAADGINRPDVHEHTVPSAMNAQELDIYVALADGLFRYDAERHALELVAVSDARAVTGLQGFVDTAPLDLVYVADYARMKLIPSARRDVYAAVCAGASAQNVYLYCASAGLETVVRGLFDERALSEALLLRRDQHILLTQTVGFPKAS